MKAPLPATRLRLLLERLRPEALFLVLACSFGVAVLAVNAPFNAPDENDHFMRVFQLSEGTLVGSRQGAKAGGMLPRLAIEATNTEGIPFHYERKMSAALFHRLAHPVLADWGREPRAFGYFPHTVTYPPAGYLPQVLAVLAGRILSVGPLGLMYLARLGGFAASVALGYAALRLLPVFRWTTLVFLLCPMSLYLFGSVASDGVLIGAAALLTALLARLKAQRCRPARAGELALLLALAGTLALAKPVYLPFTGVLLFVALPRLGSLRARALFCAAAFAVCVLPAAVWLRIAASVYVPADGNVPVDPAAQMHHMAGAPLAFLALVARTIRVQYLPTYQWMVGTLGWGDTPMPGWFYPVLAAGILACLVMESDGGGLIGWRLRAAMALSSLLSVLLIYAALYASWNPPGSRDPIVGVEGRYFLPLLPMAALCIPPFRVHPPRALVAALAGALAVLCAAVCLWAVVLRYYVSPPAPSGEPPARLTRLSIRALVGAHENILITGFTVGGHGMETLLIRAGATGLKDALARPSLKVVDANGAVLASDTGWETNPGAAQVAAAAAAAGEPALPPGGADSALVLSVPEGRYTVEVSGAPGATGLVLETLRELSHQGTRLANISSRSYVGKGDAMMVVGFVVAGTGAEALLGRADGPGLGLFGVAGALPRPTLALGPLGPGEVVNAGWGNSPDRDALAAAGSRAGAFPLAEGSADSAALVSLPPGAYTLRVYGAGDTAGVALAELYELP